MYCIYRGLSNYNRVLGVPYYNYSIIYPTPCSNCEGPYIKVSVAGLL